MSLPASTHPASRVLIIGGGIAGLSAALRLRALDPSIAVTICESSRILGGKIAGELVDGCVIDGGADVCIGDKLRTTHLFASLDLGKRTIRVNPDNLPTYEWRGGALERSLTSFAGELLTFRGGMREIVNVTCDALAGVTVRTAASVTSIRSDGPKWRVDCCDGDSQIVDAVIVATPASTAAGLLPAISQQITSRLRELESPATTTVTMAWRTNDVPRSLDGTGYLAADSNARMSACTWVSAKNPSHAPPGLALLRGYIRGTYGDPAAVMLDEVAAVLGINTPPLFTRAYKWDAGIPVYTPAYHENVRDLTAALTSAPGVFIAGSAFHGVGIPDCIYSGERAAADALSYVRSFGTEEAA